MRRKNATVIGMILLSLQGHNHWNDMANKKAKPVVGIEYDNNDLAKVLFVPLYKGWFSTFQNTSSYQSISGTLFQREVMSNQTIPYLELCSSFHERIDSENKLILFVSCNPSGRDEDYYAANNSSRDFFCYYNRADSIYNQVDDFIRVLGLTGVEFAMADVFPIVKSKQKDLEVIWENELKKSRAPVSNPFLELTNMFKEVVCEIRPTVIVAINAFVSGLFKDGFLSDNTPKPPKLINDSYYDLSYYQNNQFFNTVAFCGGMLTGQHAMDIHSRMRLMRDVRDYLNSHP